MIDIIILMNSDIDSLIKTLGSVSFQNQKDINIIIINGTDIEIKNKLNMFNDLNIRIIKCESSNLKNCGLRSTKSPYLLFINAGDLLYNCFSIRSVLSNSKDYDLITGKIAFYYDDKVDFYDNMNRYFYGKLYSREFIDTNKLKFNNSKYFSDMAFNKMYLMCKPREGLCNKEVYFTSNRIVDDNNKEYIVDYCKSFKNCIEDAIKKKIDDKEISKLVYSNVVYLYNKYNINYDKDFVNDIFKIGKDIYNYYLQFKKTLSLSDKDKINIDYRLDVDYKCSVEEFIDMFTVKR